MEYRAWSLASGGFALFALIGSTQALYGPTIPAFRAAFKITAAAAGLLLSAHFIGAVLGILLPGLLRGYPAVARWLIGGSTALFAAGCLALGAAPVWPMALGAAFLIGVGSGGLVIAFNSLFVTGFGTRGAAMVTLLNSIYGIGALAGPVLVALGSTTSFRPPFLVSGAIAAVLLPLAFSLSMPPQAAGTAGGARSKQPPQLFAFIGMFFVFGGIEVSIGGWEATQLVAQGMSAASAATATAFFWGGMTVGRLLLAPITLLVPPRRIVIAALGMAMLFAALAHVPSAAALAYALIGLCLAPLFPLGLVWLDQALPSPGGAPAWVMASDLCGGAFFPFLIGQVITVYSPASLPSAVIVLAAVSFGAALGIRWSLRRSGAGNKNHV